MQDILTKDSPIGAVFGFEGILTLLITGGIGKVTLERSVKGETEFHPLSTDLDGGIAQFAAEGGCAYNGTVEERGQRVLYRFVAEMDTGEIVVTRRTNR